jgi:hypothetical protein
MTINKSMYYYLWSWMLFSYTVPNCVRREITMTKWSMDVLGLISLWLFNAKCMLGNWHSRLRVLIRLSANRRTRTNKLLRKRWNLHYALAFRSICSSFMIIKNKTIHLWRVVYTLQLWRRFFVNGWCIYFRRCVTAGLAVSCHDIMVDLRLLLQDGSIIPRNH